MSYCDPYIVVSNKAMHGPVLDAILAVGSPKAQRHRPRPVDSDEPNLALDIIHRYGPLRGDGIDESPAILHEAWLGDRLLAFVVPLRVEQLLSNVALARRRALHIRVSLEVTSNHYLANLLPPIGHVDAQRLPHSDHARGTAFEAALWRAYQAKGREEVLRVVAYVVSRAPTLRGDIQTTMVPLVPESPLQEHRPVFVPSSQTKPKVNPILSLPKVSVQPSWLKRYPSPPAPRVGETV